MTLGISTFQAKIGEENLTSVRLFNRLHFKEVGVSLWSVICVYKMKSFSIYSALCYQVSYSSIFQEMTLHWEVTETEKQWLLDSVNVIVESYIEMKQKRETDVHS